MTQNNPKFKIKEFQWFQMETKVRQIIQQILGPLQKRILETSTVLHKVKVSQSEDEDKINQITLMIANDPKVFQTGIFQTVDHRFESQSKLIQQLSRQIKQSNKYVDQKFKILDIRMQQSSQVLRNVASLRERISKQIQLQNDNMNHLRNNLTQMIDNLTIQLKDIRLIQHNHRQLAEKQYFIIQEQHRETLNTIQNINAILQNHRSLHSQKSIKLEQHSQLILRQKQQIQNLQQTRQLTKKLQQVVKQMDNQLARAQFKIDNIAPLITQAQISDCLYYVLPTKMRKRVSVHQFKKYYILNRQVLEKPYRQVRQKFRGIQLLQQMQKKNTKQIVQLKRKKLLAMGIDIDHLTYEQRERYYNQVNLDQGIDDGDDQVKQSGKVDDKYVMQLMNKYFQQFTTQASKKINIQLQDSKKYIYGLQNQLKHELITYENKFNLIKKQAETFHTDQLLQNKSYQFQIQIQKKQNQNIRNQIQGVRQLQRLFYNFCSLVNHLQIQDQIDKQNISLMGVQQNNPEIPKQRNSIIQLDKKCFSCCGYPASTLSAFKMACLTYQPSSISIDNKHYKRQQLLQFTTNMLHNIKKLIQGDSGVKNQSQFRNTVQYNSDKQQLQTFQQSKIIKLNSEQNQISTKKTPNNKFRKTKKYNNNNSYLTTSKFSTKQNSKFTINQDMMNISAAFNQLKKRNITFLS